jgi:hypothetical protein
LPAEPPGPCATDVVGQYELIPQYEQLVDVDEPPDIVIVALAEHLLVNPEQVRVSV